MKLSIFSWLGLSLVVASCATAPSIAQSPAVPECRKFSTPVAIEGEQTQQLTGLACKQQDGTWKVAEAPPASYAAPGYAMPTAPPDALIAPNCDYPMAASSTEQCNWYLNRHKFGHH